MKLLLIVFVSITSSHGINYEALKPCNGIQGPGVACDGLCRLTLYWCNNHDTQYCEDGEVRTNNPDLCSNDDFWRQVSCNVTLDGKVNPGERCTGCTTGLSNYCFYPQGKFVDLGNPDLMRTTCDCVKDKSSDNVSSGSASSDGVSSEPSDDVSTASSDDVDIVSSGGASFANSDDGVITDNFDDANTVNSGGVSITNSDGVDIAPSDDVSTDSSDDVDIASGGVSGDPSDDVSTANSENVSIASSGGVRSPSIDDVDTASSSTVTLVVLIIMAIMISIVATGIYFYKKKLQAAGNLA